MVVAAAATALVIVGVLFAVGMFWDGWRKGG